MSDSKNLSRLRIDRTPPVQRAPGGWLAFVLLLVVSGSYIGWLHTRLGIGASIEVEVGRVLQVGGGPAASGIAANGYVVARTRAALSTDIQGRLVQLLVEEGDSVEKGDLIARLDTRQLETSLDQANAEVKRAQAAARLAKIHRDRIAELAENARDASKSELDSVQAEMEQAEALVDSLVARVQEIQVMIDKSSVYAPFAGVIIKKHAEVGEVVAATGASGTNARGAVATLVDFDTLEVQVELAQTSLQAARIGAPLLIYLDAFPEKPYRGRVRQIWPTADRQRATVELRAKFLERDQRIIPDMGVRVVFVAGEGDAEAPRQVLLPKRALTGGDDPSVFLFESGTVIRRSITLADGTLTSEQPENGNLIVKSGLHGQEWVVLDPPLLLQDGDRVRRKEKNQ
ncbi:MAG: efflux RND transporter periplasmic adaptor subunit [Planctomycetota bacterium]